MLLLVLDADVAEVMDVVCVPLNAWAIVDVALATPPPTADVALANPPPTAEVASPKPEVTLLSALPATEVASPTSPPRVEVVVAGSCAMAAVATGVISGEVWRGLTGQKGEEGE